MCRCEEKCANKIPSYSWVSSDSTATKCYAALIALIIGIQTGCVSDGSSRRSFRTLTQKPVDAAPPSIQRSRSSGSSVAAHISKSDKSDGTMTTASVPDETIRLIHVENGPGGWQDNLSEAGSVVPAPSLTGTNPGVTQTPAVAELTAMSLADLENRALQFNPTLSQAQAAVSGQQGIYHQAGLYPNPQMGYINSSASNPSVRQSNGMFYSQEFVTANKLGLAQLAASEELKRYQWDHEAQRMRVLNDLKIRFYEVLGAQEAVEAYRQLIKVSERSLKVAESLLASEGTRTDYLQAKVQLETVRLNLEEAELRYTSAWEQLAVMIGDPTMPPAPLIGEITENVPRLDFDTCWQELISCSPQLRAAESELGHGWATYHEARAIAVPNVTLQTVADYDQATQATTVSTLVALPVPIFNRNQGNIDKAAADIRADQADICRIQLVLRDQLADSFRRYQTSLRQTERLKDSILPSAEENLALCQQAFERGQTAFAPVLAAQESYFKSKVAYVEAHTELHKVITEIQGLQLTGGLNPASIGSAIQNQAGGGVQRQRALLNDLQDNASKQLLPAAQIGR
jgi:cobalt-zinc-cadmium efflux system outer membrane protein